MRTSTSVLSGLLGTLLLPISAAVAGEVVVTVSGADSTRGRVGCALFAADNAEAFPVGRLGTMLAQEPATGGPITCRFTGLAAGTYAVAASHDENENGETDTNFLGIPREKWGVSNNVRPTMRAPRFEEAAFDLAQGESLTLAIELD